MAFMFKGTNEWLNSISVSDEARKKLDSAIESLSTKAAQDNIMYKNEDSDMNKEKEAELQDAENEEVKSELETETESEAEVKTDVEEQAEEVPAVENNDTETTKAESVLAVVEKALNEVAEVIAPMQKRITELEAEVAELKAANTEIKSENVPFLSLNFNSMLESKSVTQKNETPDADTLLKEAPEEAEDTETENEQGFIPFFNFS